MKLPLLDLVPVLQTLVCRLLMVETRPDHETRQLLMNITIQKATLLDVLKLSFDCACAAVAGWYFMYVYKISITNLL